MNFFASCVRAFSIGLVLITSCVGSGLNAQSIHNSLTAVSTLTESPANDHFVKVDGLRIHYVESGSGRPVVLIHGNAGSVEDFEGRTLSLLSDHYRVLAIDRPGHGRSDRPARNASVEFQADLLHHTLSILGISDPILVGHSWGAALALAYALRYPSEVSAMVLLAPAAYPDDSGDGLLRTATRVPLIGDLTLLLGKVLVGRHMLKAALGRAFSPQPVSDRYFRIANSRWLDRKHLKAYVEDEASLNDSLKRMSKRYSEISVPVIIVTGDKDKIVSPEQNAIALHKVLPVSELIQMKDKGHEIPQTDPETIDVAVNMLSRETFESLLWFGSRHLRSQD